jgi:hypothetical protein
MKSASGIGLSKISERSASHHRRTKSASSRGASKSASDEAQITRFGQFGQRLDRPAAAISKLGQL